MSEIITFSRLKKGHVYTLEINGEKIKCKIIKEESPDLYRIKALSGPNAGQIGYFQMVTKKKKKPIEPRF